MDEIKKEKKQKLIGTDIPTKKPKRTWFKISWILFLIGLSIFVLMFILQNAIVSFLGVFLITLLLFIGMIFLIISFFKDELSKKRKIVRVILLIFNLLILGFAGVMSWAFLGAGRG